MAEPEGKLSLPEPESIYRGHSRTGFGEGPEQPISHGEQYLDATPSLKSDGAVLDEIRPWMSLDSDPADHRQLGDLLEGWSLFSTREYLFVVRLVSAGAYDRRAAYYAHGRAWRKSSWGPGLDPGVVLGRAAAFDEVWRDQEPGTHRPGAIPPESYDVAAPDEPERAASFLAHLLQAMVGGRPVIVAVPVADFAAGSQLTSQLAFARAALPVELKEHCSLRIYTRLPELFLGHVRASLVVLPETLASEAMSVRREAVLLDHNGECHSRHTLDGRAQAYAENVVDRARNAPEALLLFTERFRSQDAGLPDPADLRTLKINYYLAYGMAGSKKRRRLLLLDFLLTTAGKDDSLPWARLITEEDWARFPDDAVAEIVLKPGLGTGERKLQRCAEKAQARRGNIAQNLLEDWWDESDPRKLFRLLDVYSHKPALVSRDAVETLPISQQQIEACRQPEDVLRVVRAILLKPETWIPRIASWRQILDHFLALSSSPELTAEILEIAEGLAAAKYPVLFLYMAEFEVRLSQRYDGPLGNQIRDLLARLEKREDQEFFLDIAFDSEWRCFLRKDLVQPDGELSWTWLTTFGERLLPSPEVRTPLNAKTLLRLGSQPAENDEKFLDTLYDSLNGRMYGETREETTSALIQEGWWSSWRRQLPDSYDPRPAAFSWLKCNVWRRNDQGKAPDAPLQDWEQVIEDLSNSEGLSAEELMQLREERQPCWPWIPPFEAKQLEEGLILLAKDLDGLAILTESIPVEQAPVNPSEPLARFVLRGTPFADHLPEDALLWLIDEQARTTNKPPNLHLVESQYLYDQTHLRRGAAQMARVATVLAYLYTEPLRALQEAGGRPDLWRTEDQGYLNGLAYWMFRWTSVKELGGGQGRGYEIARTVERFLTLTSRHGINIPSKKLARNLAKEGFAKAAEFLVPGTLKRRSKERLADWILKLANRILDALKQRNTKDPCWNDLIDAVSRSFKGEAETQHPLRAVAGVIRDQDIEPADRLRLEETAWETFEAVAIRQHASILLREEDSEEWSPLPAFELMTSLASGGTLGEIASGMMFSKASLAWRARPRWWQALLLGVQNCQRWGYQRPPEDRRDLALRLIQIHAKRLDHRQQAAFTKAWRDLTPTWPELERQGETSQ